MSLKKLVMYWLHLIKYLFLFFIMTFNFFTNTYLKIKERVYFKVGKKVRKIKK